MIVLTDRDGHELAVNPEHISMARGFEASIGPKRKMTEILFLSGDWRTLEMSLKDVLCALDDARPIP